MPEFLIKGVTCSLSIELVESKLASTNELYENTSVSNPSGNEGGAMLDIYSTPVDLYSLIIVSTKTGSIIGQSPVILTIVFGSYFLQDS